MASTFTTNKRFEKPGIGEQSGTWGTTCNTDYDLIDTAIAGVLNKSVAGGVDVTLTANNGATDESRNAIYQFTGLLTANISVIVPATTARFTVYNNTTGAFTLTVKPSGGAGIVVPQGRKMNLYCDGTDVVEGMSASTSMNVIGAAQVGSTLLVGGVTTLSAAVNEIKGADIASAATTNIWATDGNMVHVTGNTTITSLGTASQAGAERTVVFDSTPILTNGANLILPGGTNITAAAGDSMVVRAESASQHRVVLYTKADGTSVKPTTTGLVPTTRTITAGTGLTGGGDLSADRTIALANTAVTPGSYTYSSITVDQQGRLTAASSGTTPVPTTRTITAGTGLSGGGDLSANRTISLANTAVTPASYYLTNLTVDQQGRITAASSGPTYAVKTIGYTVIASDMLGVIRWTTAGVTASLTAAATLGAGFRVTLVNDAASGDVTIDPNGAETLDGLSTRLLRPGDRVTLECDGSNWVTILGAYSYDTGVVSLAAKVGTVDTLAHSLGRAPNHFFARMIATNATTEQGYTQNDEVYIAPIPGDFGSAGGYGVNMVVDATNITAVWGASGLPPLFNKSTGVEFIPTASKWSWRLIAKDRFG